jgi:hypothetical protein
MPARSEMASREPRSHSFVVRIWLEDTAEETGEARWRGQVIHMPGGEREYVDDLESLCHFLAPYLKEAKRKRGLVAWLQRLFRPRGA